MQGAAYRSESETPESPALSPKGRGTHPNSLSNLKRVPKGTPSLNPSGRGKKDYDLAAAAQKHAVLAIETLAKVCANEDAPAASRVSAAGELLDRGFGRAPQSIKVNAEISFSEQFEQFVREINARVLNGAGMAAQDRRMDAIELQVCDGVPESEP